MFTIFIDGQVGTTGLQIVDRLKKRSDIEIIEIPHENRKDTQVKKEYLNSADVVVLCLPDQASKESVAMISNEKVKVLDASTAHRTHPDWTYGLPEFSADQREKIKASKRVSVPGCYPTGFILAMAPLTESQTVPSDYPVTINAVSGYSGGGRQLIEKYEEHQKNATVEQLWMYRPYAFQLNHKHLPEMQAYTGLQRPPLFMPAVGHYYQGMLISVPLISDLLKSGTTSETVHQILVDRYKDEPFINVPQLNDFSALKDGFLSPMECNSTNRVDLFVFGDQRQILVMARLDNLGKGASGAAVQNINIMIGIEEDKGL